MSEKTEFLVEVVRLGPVDKHPNADSLSLTSVNGYPCIIKTGTFKEGDLAVYVPVDSLVPTSRPEFAFLRKGDIERHRIRAVRLRGVFSMGLLVACPDGLKEGDSAQESLGVEKWLSPEERRLEAHEGRLNAQKALKSQLGKFMPVYGLDALRRNADVLIPGEEVVITEKIHGCNARYCYRNGRLFVGSHRTVRGASRSVFEEFWWKVKFAFYDFIGKPHRADLLQNAGDVWWECAEALNLKERLSRHPNLVLYGEIYGQKVQDLPYDTVNGRRFRAFDIYDVETGQFYDWDSMVDLVQDGLGLDIVPVLYRGPWKPELVEMAEGPSVLNPSHIREGIVVKPVSNRFDARVGGRVALKFASETYLLRNEARA